MSLQNAKADEEIKKYISQMKEIYEHFLSFVDNSDLDSDKSYKILLKLIETHSIEKNKEKFNHFIGILINITNNHHRQEGFFNKIERILLNFQETIKKHNTNLEIYELFESNKRILYFLIKEQIFAIDSKITDLIENKDELYKTYLFDFIPKKDNDNEYIAYYSNHLDEFEEKRRIGENDSYICSLIRQDSIKEFISYVNRSNLSLSMTIKPSIFETNLFLIDKEPTLIEYAAFFGSIEIFQYLYLNKVEISGSLWIYSIHSNNSNFIRNYIESNNIEPIDKTYEEILNECIKCHHNEIAMYIQDNLIDKIKMKEKKSKNIGIAFDERFYDIILKYHNYSFLSTDFNQSYTFFYLCKYNYQTIVDFLIQSHKELFEAKIMNQILKNIIIINSISQSIFKIKF